jgi:hypothetical protein
MSQAASPHSKDLPAGVPEIGAMYLEGVELGTLVQMYAETSGRRRMGSERVMGWVPYLKASQVLSKPEVLYVLETMLGWNNARIVLGDNNTFSIGWAQRYPRSSG